MGHWLGGAAMLSHGVIFNLGSSKACLHGTGICYLFFVLAMSLTPEDLEAMWALFSSIA